MGQKVGFVSVRNYRWNRGKGNIFLTSCSRIIRLAARVHSGNHAANNMDKGVQK
jgi:hypothetical protein